MQRKTVAETPAPQAFNNLLLSTYCVPGSEDRAVNKTVSDLSPLELTFPVGGKTRWLTEMYNRSGVLSVREKTRQGGGQPTAQILSVLLGEI